MSLVVLTYDSRVSETAGASRPCGAGDEVRSTGPGEKAFGGGAGLGGAPWISDLLESASLRYFVEPEKLEESSAADRRPLADGDRIEPSSGMKLVLWYLSSPRLALRDIECNDSRELANPAGRRYGLLPRSIDKPRSPLSAAFASAMVISGGGGGVFFHRLDFEGCGLLPSPIPKSRDPCLSSASSFRSFLTCLRWRNIMTIIAKTIGTTVPTTMGIVVSLDFTGRSHGPVVSLGPHDVAADESDEVPDACLGSIDGVCSCMK